MPWIVAAAVIGHCLHHNEIVVAIAIILAFTCYLRPSELETLTVRQLVPPALARYRDYGRR
eukprot:12428166-Karenia_brevis.AAC.1